MTENSDSPDETSDLAVDGGKQSAPALDTTVPRADTYGMSLDDLAAWARGKPAESEARGLEVARRDDGVWIQRRKRPPQEAVALARCLDSRLGPWQGEKGGMRADVQDALAQDFEQQLESAGCRNPVEDTLMRQMLINHGMLRRLQMSMSNTTSVEQTTRLAELSLRCAGMGAKQAAAWAKLRQPPRVSAVGGQVNVAGGHQQVVNSTAHETEERTVRGADGSSVDA